MVTVPAAPAAPTAAPVPVPPAPPPFALPSVLAAAATTVKPMIEAAPATPLAPPAPAEMNSSRQHAAGTTMAEIAHRHRPPPPPARARRRSSRAPPHAANRRIYSKRFPAAPLACHLPAAPTDQTRVVPPHGQKWKTHRIPPRNPSPHKPPDTAVPKSLHPITGGTGMSAAVHCPTAPQPMTTCGRPTALQSARCGCDGLMAPLFETPAPEPLHRAAARSALQV